MWRRVFKQLEPDIGVNEAHNLSAAADVKEIGFIVTDFHNVIRLAFTKTKTFTNIWNGEFGEESTCLQTMKKNICS